MDRARPKSKICAKQRLYVKHLAQCHPDVTKQSSGTLNVKFKKFKCRVKFRNFEYRVKFCCTDKEMKHKEADAMPNCDPKKS